MIYALKINPKDMVAIVPKSIDAGEEVRVSGTQEQVIAREAIPAGHKIALMDLKQGDLVVKYGIPIGRMMSDCPAGGWVHCHNLEDNTAELCTGHCEKYRESGRKIMAYPRADGQFGIRNYLMIFSTSIAGNALAEQLSNATSTVWWVCDKRFLEDGHISDFTKMAIEKTAENPNIYAALIVGDEADRARNESICAEIREVSKKDVCFCAADGGAEALRQGTETLERWQAAAAALKREPVSMEGFMMAVHCGGSDWTTALSGNPTLGVAADHIVEEGGYVVMDEWGGLPGSEHLLAGSARTRKLGLEIIDKVMEVRERYIRDTGKPVEETNPYQCNKDGGITTLVEKSTGNIKKAGSSGVQGILKMATRPTTPGVYLQDQPCGGPNGTGIYAAMCGCHVHVFVTGVGYVYYEIPYMPGIRMTGNSETFANPVYKLDFNAGTAMEGHPMADVGKELFEYIIAVAEGREEPKTEKDKLLCFPMYYYADEFAELDGYYDIDKNRDMVQKKVQDIKE